MPTRTFWIIPFCLALCTLYPLAQSPDAMIYKPAADAKFTKNATFPPCGVAARQDSNPSTGSSTILIKLTAGCVLPWHWHTSNERIIMIRGSAKAEMKDMPPTKMEQGDFLLLPSKHIHQFTATTDVEFFDISETTFDIHYVDSSGNEISVESALKTAPPSPAK